MNEILYTCTHNENCQNVENCPIAIEITTLNDVWQSMRRFMKGMGICEIDKESE